MPLSKEEKQQLDELTRKSKEPDAPRGNVNFSLDLSDTEAYKRAQKLGLVPGDDTPDDDDDDDDEADDAPKRRGLSDRWAGGN
jgi:hypothetical protein